MTTRIDIQDITKIYNERKNPFKALDAVSLTIEPGELFFLLGPSGCGKTTLLRTIAGLLEPTSGRIFFNDRDVTQQLVEQRNTAMVFQNYALWPHMTIRQNVEFGPRMRKVESVARKERAESCLEMVSMKEYSRRKPNQLSGGQQQRVALARALAAQPDCLLLDEPLSNLDAALRQRMRLELHNMIKSQGITAVYVTHDQTEALSMADRIAVMRDGVIEQIDSPAQVYFSPVSKFVADFVGEGNFIKATFDPSTQQQCVQTEIGTLKVKHHNALRSQNVLCCIRPEHVQIVLPGSSNHEWNEINAMVENVVFQGDTTRIIVKLDNMDKWKITQVSHFNSLTVKNGQTVKLKFLPESVIILDH